MKEFKQISRIEKAKKWCRFFRGASLVMLIFGLILVMMGGASYLPGWVYCTVGAVCVFGIAVSDAVYRKFIREENEKIRTNREERALWHTELFECRDCSRFMDGIMQLAKRNPSYDFTDEELLWHDLQGRYVYEYTFAPKKTELRTNLAKEQGEVGVYCDEIQVGRLKNRDAQTVRRILRSKAVEKTVCELSSFAGGNYIRLHHSSMKDLVEFNQTEFYISVLFKWKEKTKI